METKIYKEDKVVTCINCITGKTEELIFQGDRLTRITETESSEKNNPFIGPGLIDLQVNGINGIDFNNPSLTREDIVKATHFLLSKGITTFFPTIITNSDKNILEIVRTIYMACISDAIVNDCMPCKLYEQYPGCFYLN